MKALFILASFGSCIFSCNGIAKAAFSETELGPYKFLSYISSNTGAIAPKLDQGNAGSSIEIRDPLISGVPVNGIISADNHMTNQGPITWVNVNFTPITSSGIDLAFIDVISEVTYDLVALGPQGEAEIEVTGTGIAQSGLGIRGMLSRATASRQAVITLTATDTTGDPQGIEQAWLIRGVDPYHPGEAAHTQIKEAFTIVTNQLYKVRVSSKSTIRLANILTFHVSALAQIKSSFQSLSPDVTVHVSDYSFGGSLSPSPPAITTIRGENATTAVISGGALRAADNSFRKDFQVGDSVKIPVTIQPELKDIGQCATIFVLATQGDKYFQLTPAGVINFTGTVESLQPFTKTTLRGILEIDLLAPFGGELFLTELTTGKFNIFVGYSINDGDITYTENPITLNISPF